MCEGDLLHGRANGARLSVDGAARLRRGPHRRQPHPIRKMSVTQAAREIEEGFASLREAIGKCAHCAKEYLAAVGRSPSRNESLSPEWRAAVAQDRARPGESTWLGQLRCRDHGHLPEEGCCFKGIICVDISEFESYMPSHAVRSLWAMFAWFRCGHRCIESKRKPRGLCWGCEPAIRSATWRCLKI